jgi:hypothetical protein
MARSAARLKMGYYPLPESEGAKLRELLIFTGPASVVDPCVGLVSVPMRRGGKSRACLCRRPGSRSSLEHVPWQRMRQ